MHYLSNFWTINLTYFFKLKAMKFNKIISEKNIKLGPTWGFTFHCSLKEDFATATCHYSIMASGCFISTHQTHFRRSWRSSWNISQWWTREKYNRTHEYKIHLIQIPFYYSISNSIILRLYLNIFFKKIKIHFSNMCVTWLFFIYLILWLKIPTDTHSVKIFYLPTLP